MEELFPKPFPPCVLNFFCKSVQDGNNIGDKGVQHLSQAFAKYDKLDFLSFDGSGLNATRVETMMPTLSKTTLRALTLSHNNVGARGMKAIAKFVKGSHLRKLDLDLQSNIFAKVKVG